MSNRINFLEPAYDMPTGFFSSNLSATEKVK